jgi:hypothetical protein
VNGIAQLLGYIQREVEKAHDGIINSAMTTGNIHQVEDAVRNLMMQAAGDNACHVILRATGNGDTVTIQAGNFYTAMLLVGVEVNPLATIHVDANGTKYGLAHDGSLNIYPALPLSRIEMTVVLTKPVTELTCQLCGAKVEEIQPLLPDPCNDDPLVRCTDPACGVEYFTNEGKRS